MGAGAGGKDVLHNPSFASLNIAISLLQTDYVVAVQVDTWMFAGVGCSSTAASALQNWGPISSVMGGRLLPRMSFFSPCWNLNFATMTAASARFWVWSVAILADAGIL